MKYGVTVRYATWGIYEVEAANIEEAEGLVEQHVAQGHSGADDTEKDIRFVEDDSGIVSARSC